MLLDLEDRRYRVRGWQKPLNPEMLKINLMVSKGQRFHVDTLDLYQAKARAAFVKQASLELSNPRRPAEAGSGKGAAQGRGDAGRAIGGGARQRRRSARR